MAETETMTEYAVAHVDDIPELDDGRCPMRPVRHHFGITGFGTTAWTARNAGDRIINEHQEAESPEEVADRNEELYVVIQGRATFELDGERRDAPAGTLVFVPPRVNRTAFAEEPGTTIVAVGGTPGKPYLPLGWELWVPLRPLYEAGDYAQVVERGRELIEANPGYPVLYYNVACCESLSGQTTEALEHVRRAIELSEQFRDYAKNDSDFDAIRDEPAFKDLIRD
jgi:mannose-6-phosphate isomerase-like protein (cupin superfamily)